MFTPSKWTNNLRRTAAILLILVTAGCNLPADSTPTPDLFATLQASTPLGVSTPSLLKTPEPTIFASEPAILTPTALPTDGIPSPSPADGLTGKIVFTCQMFKVQARDQICIMYADGSGFRRLTVEDALQHYYPSLSPDGKSVLFSAFVDAGNYDIYEMRLDDGTVTRLSNGYGEETAPEVSPDGTRLTYAKFSTATGNFQIIVADRNGRNAGNIARAFGWDPTWSPDGKRILFASDRSGTSQLQTIRTDATDLKVITSLPALRGRSDWSPDGSFIVTYSGPAWEREVFILNADGSNARQLTPGGGNSQGPSISPDGRWVAFTAYFDNYGDENGCEIYVIRTDGTDLRRLTKNDYCDYQPRWGP